MPFEARVSPRSNMKNVRFSGDFEFVLYEWRPLPDDKVELARKNPYLEVRQTNEAVETLFEKGTADELLETGTADEFLEEGTADKFLNSDDLTEIKGVGRATAGTLSLYYPTFESLAEADPNELQSTLEKTGLSGRLDAEYLIEKAGELV